MYKMISDKAQTVDRLGFEPMADILSQVVLNTEPPFTIGVFGEWGSGKTTLMNLVQKRLDSSNCKSVWFNAWKYDGKELVWNALIQSIFAKICAEKQSDGTDLADRVKDAALNLARFAGRRWLGAVSGGVLDKKTLDGIGDALRPLSAADEEFEFVNKFEETFSSLVAEYVGPDGRLVVFVDDLDRCLPENAVEVLEAIKLYLDNANVTFVIGVEPEVVHEGIRHRYKNNNRLSERAYLEKIIQLPFLMRSPDRASAMDLIQPFAKTAEYINDNMITGMLLSATRSNPRRIKRFINTCYVLGEIRKQTRGELVQDDARRLALVLLIQMQFGGIYDRLVSDPGLILRWTQTSQKSGPNRQRDIETDEDLKNIDADEHAREFLTVVEGLDCSEHLMREFVQLTRGE